MGGCSFTVRIVVIEKYLTDEIINAVEAMFEDGSAFFELAHIVSDSMECGNADAFYDILPEFAKENVDLLQKYIESDDSFTSIMFMGDMNDLIFIGEEGTETEKEQMKASLRAKLIMSVMSKKSLIIVTRFCDEAEYEYRFIVRDGNISTVAVDQFDAVMEEVEDYIVDSNEETESEGLDDKDEFEDVNEAETVDEDDDVPDPIRKTADLIFKKGIFKLDEDKIDQCLKENSAKYEDKQP